jgi:hypothetical protein
MIGAVCRHHTHAARFAKVERIVNGTQDGTCPFALATQRSVLEYARKSTVAFDRFQNDL